MVTLEEELEGEFVQLEIEPNNQESIRIKLALLKEKDKNTYEHSMRVGLLATRIARHMHLDPKAFFYAGTLHDIGKLLIDPETLKKTEGFNEKDMQQMRKHPFYTRQMLRGIHEYSAEMALRHHRHQKNGYPKRLPKSPVPFSGNTRLMIDYHSRILSLADFYDAITTRVNDKFGEKRKLTSDEARSLMLLHNPDQRYLIKDLYDNGIFGEEGEPKDETITDEHDFLYASLWRDWTGTRTARETRRFVTLACVLEPLSDKAGCTTRNVDLNRFQKLEYFVAGAVNIGEAFEDLAQRALDSEGQPTLVYDLAYKAQADCKKNRAGGRVNQGIIELLTPIITAQIISDPGYTMTVDDILDKSKEVLRSSSPQDVAELIKMKRLAFDLSGYHDREVPNYEVDNVLDYYSKDLSNSHKPTSVKHNEEFVLGFPILRKVYHTIMDSRRTRLKSRVEESYTQARRENPEVSPGFIADCSAAGIYLILSHHPKDKVIR